MFYKVCASTAAVSVATAAAERSCYCQPAAATVMLIMATAPVASIVAAKMLIAARPPLDTADDECFSALPLRRHSTCPFAQAQSTRTTDQRKTNNEATFR
ncbi:unnamed protein product, partial [Ceratitis capitata]